jgi:hypothetical protein
MDVGDLSSQVYLHRQPSQHSDSGLHTAESIRAALIVWWGNAAWIDHEDFVPASHRPAVHT